MKDNEAQLTAAVRHPTHYNIYLPDGTRIECADVVDGLRGRWEDAGFDVHRVSCAFEYLFRAGAKDNAEQDLQKALNYLHKAVTGRWIDLEGKDE